MPRPINFGLLDLFDYNDTYQIRCYNGNCRGKVLFRHSGNLQRHLKSLHHDILLSYMENKTILQHQGGFYMQTKLIDLVRSKPILWDRSYTSTNDSNRNLYIEAWEEISKKLNLNMDICKQKWKNLRNYFRKEMLNKTTTDVGSDHDLCSNWKLFSSLIFLRDEVLPRKNSENNKQDEIDFILNSIKEESNESSVSQLGLGTDTEEDECSENMINKNNENESMKRFDYHDNDNLDKQPKAKKIKVVPDNENDEERMFLLSLVPYLKTIPENRRLIVRHRIQCVLLEDQAFT